MPTDPLAELQAQRALHDERHRGWAGTCDTEYCEDGRWLALCDRLAFEARRFEGAYRNNLLGLAELDAHRATAEQQRDAAEAGATGIKAAIEALDLTLQQQGGQDGFVEMYLMWPGQWHKLLGFARGVDAGAALLARAAVAERRAAELEKLLGCTTREWSIDDAKALMFLAGTKDGAVAWRYLLRLEKLLLETQSERSAAEHQRDKVAAALEDSEKLPAAATLAGQQILDRLHGLEAALEREQREEERLRDALGWDPEDPADNADLLGSAALTCPPATEGA